MSDDAPSMTSYRPYLLRALTEWINDNGMTPHILVDAGVPGVRVPPGTVREGKVVLNIADRAVGRRHQIGTVLARRLSPEELAAERGEEQETEDD